MHFSHRKWWTVHCRKKGQLEEYLSLPHFSLASDCLSVSSFQSVLSSQSPSFCLLRSSSWSLIFLLNPSLHPASAAVYSFYPSPAIPHSYLFDTPLSLSLSLLEISTEVVWCLVLLRRLFPSILRLDHSHTQAHTTYPHLNPSPPQNKLNPACSVRPKHSKFVTAWIGRAEGRGGGALPCSLPPR